MSYKKGDYVHFRPDKKLGYFYGEIIECQFPINFICDECGYVLGVDGPRAIKIHSNGRLFETGPENILAPQEVLKIQELSDKL